MEMNMDMNMSNEHGHWHEHGHVTVKKGAPALIYFFAQELALYNFFVVYANPLRVDKSTGTFILAL